jgi:hypothetical protein
VPYIYESIDLVALPHYDDTHPISTGKVYGTISPLPGGGGFDPAGTGRRGTAPAKITMRGALVTSTDTGDDIDTDWHALAAKHDTVVVLWRRRLKDNSRQWRRGRLVSLDADKKFGTRYVQPVELSIDIIDPAWYGETPQAITITDIATDDEDLTTAGAESAGGSAVFTVTNSGNKDVTNALLTITAGASAITAATVTMTGVDLTYDSAVGAGGSVGSGHALIIDAGGWKVTNNGADAWSSLAFNSGHTVDRWLVIPPGTWTITVALTPAIEHTVALSFYPTYV